jgi:hypothetical protein
MAENTELFEYLFAVRISLQDDFENESDIIRELKLNLRDMGMGSTQANQLLHDFYQAYGIDISIDTIKEASAVSSQLLNNILGFMLSPEDFAHSGHPDDVANEDEDDDDIVNEAPNTGDEDDINGDGDDDEDEDDITGDEDDNTGHEDEDDNIANGPTPLHAINNYTNGSISFNINGNTFSFNHQNTQNHHLLASLLSQAGGFNPSIIQNAPMLNINSSNIGTHSSMFNVLNSILNNNNNFVNGNITTMPVGPSMFSDVVVSTDEKVLDSLKTFKLETKLDTDCSICMGHLDKDEEVSELRCTHTFHSECIKPYLLQYNYKCPVCRTEVGKAKYNI